MTHCYRCPVCGESAEFGPGPIPFCGGSDVEGTHHDLTPMRRDYRAEAANVDRSSLHA